MEISCILPTMERNPHLSSSISKNYDQNIFIDRDSFINIIKETFLIVLIYKVEKNLLNMWNKSSLIEI